jgi:hypothetical protein
MTSVKSMQRLVGGKGDNKRNKDDFYRTPTYATRALLKREKFEGLIWEPACGDGAISRVLEAEGYTVHSSDLCARGYGVTGLDFLSESVISGVMHSGAIDNVVTNPPFNLATKFALRALEITSNKVVLFGKLTFLEGKGRGEKLFSQRKLARIWAFTQRVGFVVGNKLPVDPDTGLEYEPDTRGNGMLAFAWYVFDHNHNGPPTLDWIPEGE